MPERNKWFDEILKKGWLSKVEGSSNNEVRLASPIQFIVPETIIQQLSEEYDPAFEKGGVMMAAFETVKGQRSLTVKHFVFLKNCSPNPADSYQPAKNELREKLDASFFFHLIPLIFHTHPTKSYNIIEEIKNFHFQMETSSPDRFWAMAIKYRFNGYTLRLPEALVIGNGTLKHGLFVGLYGGLVAPLGFNKQKNKRMYNWLLARAYDIVGSINSLEDLAAVGVIGLVAHGIMSHDKKSTRHFLQQARQVLQPLVYADAAQQDFFGITHKKELMINLPLVSDGSILEEEKLMQALILQQRKRSKQYYYNYTVDLTRTQS
ncbi:MAG: hypothetical protein QM726_04225 [Chitinophagaceae bacterium]